MGLEPDRASAIGGRLSSLAGGGENGTMKLALIGFPCSPEDGVVSMPEDADEAIWVSGRGLFSARVDGPGAIQISGEPLSGSQWSFQVAYSWVELNRGFNQGLSTEWHFELLGGSVREINGIVVLEGDSLTPNEPETLAQQIASAMAGVA